MVALHIEHPITDMATWVSAFTSFAEKRREAGGLSATVRHPVGDDHYVVVDVDFATEEQATAFLGFLQNVVWANRENSPALDGTPEVKILVPVDLPD